MTNALLGTDKDVEDLARRARRAGWTVTVDGRTHLRWQSPGAAEFRSPLTGGRGHRQRVERRLAAVDPAAFSELAPAVARRASQVQNSCSRTVSVPSELEVCAAELSALADLLDELLHGGELTAGTIEGAADEIRIGRSLLRDAEDGLRSAGRAASR